MGFAEKRRWIDDNPATELEAPKVPNIKRAEMIRVLTALEPYGKRAGIRNSGPGIWWTHDLTPGRRTFRHVHPASLPCI
jgi:hypothetical protein